MPELPEVETIVRQLNRAIRGRTITNFTCSSPKMLATRKLADFQKKIKNKKILKLERRGKIILISLSRDLALAIHLRLTGQLFVREVKAPADRFNRAVFTLGKKLELRFNDLRLFGQIWLYPKAEIENNFDKIQKLGPEPFDKTFTLENFKNILRNRRTKIKALLLDQSKISGLGNIYSDEVLFYAGIAPLAPANKISSPRAKKFYLGIKIILADAIASHGTSVDTYYDATGKKGKYAAKLKVYRRTGQPCFKCDTKIQRIKIGGRSSHFCPKCQKL
ncbi:formamidopyrimidine-DNA glycosylase [bacterium (Candidatus Torokbacteria) CG09_land_8_20_14_0_10_42_11]|nr:MAG: formamidopyrimidine-DNA glycosylase [bacterium (Candidatus Torokbacteria) CG09_land_8_20_14_0_10_42_11]